MIVRHRFPGRRALPLLAASATLALAGGAFAISAGSATAQMVSAQREQSANWAGYVVHSKTGQSFSAVSGSWTQPSVSASSGQGYSAFWVGLGGASADSPSLEQTGTSAEVVNGKTQYYAWYELVPAPETRLNIAIHPGDHISARVTVHDTTVTVSLSDQTTGKSVSHTLQMINPDTSSAEWIAEAPATESPGGGTQILPLANFGKVTFANASTTADGQTGSISDPSWSVQEIQLSSDSGAGMMGPGELNPSGIGLGTGSRQSSTGASPGMVSNGGSSFSVAYSANSGSQSSTGGESGFSTGGYGGGYGYGYGGGYGYGYGWGYPGV